MCVGVCILTGRFFKVRLRVVGDPAFVLALDLDVAGDVELLLELRGQRVLHLLEVVVQVLVVLEERLPVRVAGGGEAIVRELVTQTLRHVDVRLGALDLLLLSLELDAFLRLYFDELVPLGEHAEFLDALLLLGAKLQVLLVVVVLLLIVVVGALLGLLPVAHIAALIAIFVIVVLPALLMNHPATVRL